MRILVVDDSEDVRPMLVQLLEREPGWHVVGEAANGEEAIERAEQLELDLVLLDMAMPVMDGLTALPHLRERLPRATIVVLTAFPREQVWDDARARGADGCLEKTAVVRRLRAQLLEILDGGKVPSQASGAHDHATPSRADPGA